MNNIEHHSVIDISIHSRDFKKLIEKIKPLKINKHTIYLIKEKHKIYKLVTLGPPSIKYYYRKKHDILSGLKHRIREASINHYNRRIIEIYWEGSYYRIKLNLSPLTIRIIE